MKRTDDFASLVATDWSRAVMQASLELATYRPQVLAALASADAEVRSAAVASFSEANDADAHEAIVGLIDDPAAVVRHEVAEYLSEFAIEEDLPRLVERLHENELLFHLTKALCRLTGWSGGLLLGEEPKEELRETISRWQEIARSRPGQLSPNQGRGRSDT